MATTMIEEKSYAQLLIDAHVALGCCIETSRTQAANLLRVEQLLENHISALDGYFDHKIENQADPATYESYLDIKSFLASLKEPLPQADKP